MGMTTFMFHIFRIHVGLFYFALTFITSSFIAISLKKYFEYKKEESNNQENQENNQNQQQIFHFNNAPENKPLLSPFQHTLAVLLLFLGMVSNN